MEAGIPTKKRAEKVYDNSMLVEYQTCPKKAYFKYKENIRPKVQNLNLWFGQMYHKAVEVLLPPNNGTPEDVEKVIKSYTPPPTEGLRTQEKLRKLVQKYVREKMPPRWDKTFLVEKAMSIPIGEYTFAVNPDTVVEWRDGGIYGWERKHTSRLSDIYFEKFNRDSQIDAQMLVIQKDFGKCNGIIVEAGVIRKGGVYAKKPEVEFFTDIKSRIPDELKASIDYFYHWMNKFEEDGTFAENRHSCYAYGQPCEFMPICRKKITNIDEHYNREVWDPLNRS